MMKKKPANKKLSILIIVGFLLLLMLGSGFYYKNQLDPVQGSNEIVSFEVLQGDTSSSIVNRLEEQGIIKNSFVAEIHTKFAKYDAFHVGEYKVDKAWNTSEILTYLSNVDNIDNTTITLTFREGLWAKDIAGLLEEYMGVSKDELLALWNDADYVRSLQKDYPFLTDEIFEGDKRVLLEGYLFPDTYEFLVDADADSITRTFLNQFNVVYNRNKADFDASDKTIDEIVTMASVVQFESRTVEDMYTVSGVFNHRLQIGMKMESSVTVCYSLYEYDSWEDCETNHLIDSPYNTYVYSGLPVGPILNPGEHAIQAALKPEDTDYLYFIADVYGDGTVHYAKTYEEHMANIEKYLNK